MEPENCISGGANATGVGKSENPVLAVGDAHPG